MRSNVQVRGARTGACCLTRGSVVRALQQRSINAAQAPAEERPLSALPRGARLSDGVRGEQGANARGAEASSVMTPPRTHSSTHSSPRVSVTPPSEFKTQLAELRRLHTQMDTREDADAPPSAVQAHDGARGSGTPWNISAYPHAASSTQGLEVPPSISAYTDSEYTRSRLKAGAGCNSRVLSAESRKSRLVRDIPPA